MKRQNSSVTEIYLEYGQSILSEVMLQNPERKIFLLKNQSYYIRKYFHEAKIRVLVGRRQFHGEKGLWIKLQNTSQDTLDLIFTGKQFALTNHRSQIFAVFFPSENISVYDSII